MIFCWIDVWTKNSDKTPFQSNGFFAGALLKRTESAASGYINCRLAGDLNFECRKEVNLFFLTRVSGCLPKI
jgi:hypothetical protein